MISYDYQAGSYIKTYASSREFMFKYSGLISEIIDKLGPVESLMEVGVGESTTLGPLLEQIQVVPNTILGFDISWSRLNHGKKFLNDLGFNKVKLFVADLFNIPLKDNSVEVVYTSHSIEPNGGLEKEALAEIYRVASKYVILLEPGYEFASDEAKERMKAHGYATKLKEAAHELNLNIIEYRLFDLYSHESNPTALVIIKKDNTETNPTELVCPFTGEFFTTEDGSALFSKNSFLAYPKLKGIPCLLKENAILAVHFDYN
jgi:ubiquinone/menaquinone biosynthesis C-methylase UbiE